MILASDLYAQATGVVNEGVDTCHWCGAACDRLVPHDDPPPMIGVRRIPCKKPGNAYVCLGCQRYKRPRITVTFMDGSFMDRQNPCNHSWFLEPGKALGVKKECYSTLYKTLFSPPLLFSLALLDGPGPNLLQLMLVNDLVKIEACTPLAFTINGVPHHYTVYELEQAALEGPAGTEPGVQALLRLLGKPPEECYKTKKPTAKRERGRVLRDDGKVTKKVINASGMVTA